AVATRRCLREPGMRSWIVWDMGSATRSWDWRGLWVVSDGDFPAPAQEAWRKMAASAHVDTAVTYFVGERPTRPVAPPPHHPAPGGQGGGRRAGRLRARPGCGPGRGAGSPSARPGPPPRRWAGVQATASRWPPAGPPAR